MEVQTNSNERPSLNFLEEIIENEIEDEIEDNIKKYNAEEKKII